MNDILIMVIIFFCTFGMVIPMAIFIIGKMWFESVIEFFDKLARKIVRSLYRRVMKPIRKEHKAEKQSRQAMMQDRRITDYCYENWYGGEI